MHKFIAGIAIFILQMREKEF